MSRFSARIVTAETKITPIMSGISRTPRAVESTMRCPSPREVEDRLDVDAHPERGPEERERDPRQDEVRDPVDGAAHGFSLSASHRCRLRTLPAPEAPPIRPHRRRTRP